jgi:hypothetical protein
MHKCNAWGSAMYDNNPEFAAAVQVRLSGATFTSLENWRRSQQKIPARSEALRILVERALAKDDRPSGEAGA